MDEAEHRRTATPVAAAASAGVVATGVALGVAELAAGLLAGAASPVVAVGDAVVDLVPVGVKNLAIEVFGQSDKIALIVGTLLIAAAVGGGLGVAARRHFLWAAGGFAAFGALGVLAAGGDPQASMAATAVAVTVGMACGLGALWLLQRATSMSASSTAGGPGRRRFLRLAGGGLVIAAAAAWTGRSLRTRTAAAASRNALVVPTPAATVSPLPDGTDFEIAGLAPFATPNDNFYRIDTALSVPRVDVRSWRLKVTGMVDRPLELSFDELVDIGLQEHWTTLACVSNEVGGHLIGNAKWSGVMLRDVLDLAGIQLEASQIVGRSVDGWTAGFPRETAYDGRAAMVAVSMNGEPLPLEHGFPARLVVPGLYGYVSATKWLSEIELTTWDAFDAYWVPRGWSKKGPIKTQSRIDTPRSGSARAGKVMIAGVAWAQQRGIERVEVQVEDGPWNEARLADVPNVDTWRQWAWEWDATPGSYIIRVRATDSDGNVQTAERAPVMPDGATGYHHIVLQVLPA